MIGDISLLSCLQPVTECTELPGDFVAVNAFSVSGSVSHILLERHRKVKPTMTLEELSPDRLPRMVILQARNEDAALALTQKVMHCIHDG